MDISAIIAQMAPHILELENAPFPSTIKIPGEYPVAQSASIFLGATQVR